LCSVYGCSKCPLNNDCYFSIKSSLVSKLQRNKNEEENTTIAIIYDTDSTFSKYVDKLEDYLSRNNFNILKINNSDFSVKPEEHIWDFAEKNVSLVLYYIQNRSIKKSIYALIELLEAGENLIVLIDKKTKIWRKLGAETFYIENNKDEVLEKLVKRILERIKRPINNIYIITYPNEIEKALDSMVLTLLQVPVKVSRRWLGLKIIEGNKKAIKKLEEYLEIENKDFIKKTLRDLWEKFKAPPYLFVSAAREKLLKELTKETRYEEIKVV